jgi:hypothetical protein
MHLKMAYVSLKQMKLERRIKWYVIENNPKYPLDRRLGRPQEPVWTQWWRRKNSQPPPRIEPPNSVDNNTKLYYDIPYSGNKIHYISQVNFTKQGTHYISGCMHTLKNTTFI